MPPRTVRLIPKLSLAAPSCPPNDKLIRLVPDLSAAAFRQRKKLIPLALWHRLRVMDSQGKGIMSLDLAIQGLIDKFGYSRRTAFRHLARAEGQLWCRAIHKPGPVIEIYGLKRACEYLNTCLSTGDKHWRELPIEQFGLGQEAAQLYASIHKPSGVRANPISRQSIEEYTGLHKVQQRRYEIEAGIKRTANSAVWLVDGKPVPLKQLIVTKGKQYQVNKRIGQIYHSKAQPSNKGMLKKVSSQLRNTGSLIPDEAASMAITKRYFHRARSLVQALTRKDNPIPEGYRLLQSNGRLIRGRLEWCYECV